MFITVNDTDYELNTKLRTAQAIEKRFKLPMFQVLDKLDNAEIGELVAMLSLSAKQTTDEFKNALLEAWDYTDLYAAVQELVVRIMFSGTPEQNETKIDKFPSTDAQKNVFRAMLGLPEKKSPDSIGSE